MTSIPERAPELGPAGADGAESAADRSLTVADVEAAFTGRVRSSPLSAGYRAGLTAVAVAMVWLPALYLALIAATLGLVGWHATQNFSLLSRAGGTTGKALLYFGPLAIGLILAFFLIKPLLARAAKAADPVTVSPAEEPVLFAFLARLCEVVGAPMPSEVILDAQVNASAGFRRGWRSLVGGDLVLTLGLPLAGGLSARALGGVLAHEFGHFAQGVGMRLTYVIRSVNHWFARVVYERDEWDAQLEQAARQLDPRVGVVLHVARGGVACARAILWLLMQIGTVLSAFLLRQMEYDADSYEAKVAGSREFERTVRQLHLLMSATAASYEALRPAWAQRRLPDDFPAFILARADATSPESRAAIDTALASARTGRLDTHPSDADRLRAVQALREPGVLELERPAVDLFADFAARCREVTRWHYAHELGLPLAEARLLPLGEFSALAGRAPAAAGPPPSAG